MVSFIMAALGGYSLQSACVCVSVCVCVCVRSAALAGEMIDLCGLRTKVNG